MDTKMGYCPTTCRICGERYNIYSPHSCPLSLGEAQAHLILAARNWTSQYTACPVRTNLEAALWNRVADYDRSMKAEPFRKTVDAQMTVLGKVLAHKKCKCGHAFKRHNQQRGKGSTGCGGFGPASDRDGKLPCKCRAYRSPKETR